MKELVDDLRKVMLPNTAVNLQEQEKNTLKDFVNVAGPLGVTHFMVLSGTDIGTYLRLIKVPQGPTLTFKVSNYTLQSDLLRIQTHKHQITFEYKTPPILIMNNFTSEEKHIQLMSTTFQSFFPSLNIEKVVLDDCKRVVLMSYDKDSDSIEYRHYIVTTSKLGMSKSVKRIIQRKVGPLSDYSDIADYVLSGTGASESDVEDLANDNKVVLEKKSKTSQNAIKLKEIGPRMTLKLVKIEEGVSDGEVLYHSIFKKTKKEEEELRLRQERKRKLKEQRRKEQERHVERKKRMKKGNNAVEEDEDHESMHQDEDNDDMTFDE